MRSVIWPAEVRSKVNNKLLDLSAAYNYAQRKAYNYKTFERAVASGDWA